MKSSKLTAELIDRLKRNKGDHEALLPLEYLLAEVMDVNLPRAERRASAIAAAPYVHPKLSSIEIQDDHSDKLVIVLQSFSRDGTNTAMIETKPLVPMPVIEAVTSDADDDD